MPLDDNFTLLQLTEFLRTVTEETFDHDAAADDDNIGAMHALISFAERAMYSDLNDALDNAHQVWAARNRNED